LNDDQNESASFHNGQNPMSSHMKTVQEKADEEESPSNNFRNTGVVLSGPSKRV